MTKLEEYTDLIILDQVGGLLSEERENHIEVLKKELEQMEEKSKTLDNLVFIYSEFGVEKFKIKQIEIEKTEKNQRTQIDIDNQKKILDEKKLIEWILADITKKTPSREEIIKGLQTLMNDLPDDKSKDVNQKIVDRKHSKICPICYQTKSSSNVICNECNNKCWIESGIQIRNILEKLLENEK